MNAKLELWRERYAKAEAAFAGELALMDERERLYAGESAITAADGRGRAKSATHVRNIIAELIDAQIDSAVPQPKVTARRKQDEGLAALIEDMLRNELDRMDFETMNDMQERTALIQGAGLFLCEWDSKPAGSGGKESAGKLSVRLLHPSRILPQPGVTEGVESMDYFIFTLPQTRQSIYRRYGKKVDGADGNNGWDDAADAESELVTQCFAYYRGEGGGVGLFSWAGDTVLCDMEDYQARQSYTCESCGAPGYGVCENCGGEKFSSREDEYEMLRRDIVRSDASVIPAVENGIPTLIPYYKPGRYPIIIRKNVSSYGKLLGDSDADKIRDQQNTVKKLSTKIGEKLLKGGSYVTLPAGVSVDKTDGELKIIYLDNPAQKQMIDVVNVQPNISGDLTYQNHVYEEARQAIGITDSFLGRRDPTATSGAAKEFAAAQSAGRFESKRVMKNAAYAALFELMFKFKLAYADEHTPVVSSGAGGGRVYREFSRYDFLARDENGKWYWNDDFLFSTDISAPLAQNREALWRETTRNFQSGAFGDPALPETLILYWHKLELLHYPGAAATKAQLEEKSLSAAPPVLPAV
ncbi:MAG: hypothetical protein LBR85_04205 [Oscillospiraceae bacterium]|jgi:hypothetical protein|nr:hypothetical protein [Oscillospiraceae bacterium]